jgi:hypothetical protein
MVGLGSFVAIVTLWKWKVGPHMKRKTAQQAESFANDIFMQEQKTKDEAERNKFY